MTTPDPLAQLRSAQAEVDRRIRAVAPQQWDDTTPCDGWTVHALVVHLVDGADEAATVLTGGTWRGSTAHARPTSELTAAWTRNAATEVDAFARAGALEQTVVHPEAGEMPGAQWLGMRVGDYLLHAWDLARATGGDEALDADLVAGVYSHLEPMRPFIAQLGIFGDGPSGHVADDAPLQTRLLDLTGRRP